MAIQTQIEQKLAALTPDVLQVENESHMHNVPANSETHFKVTLVSDSFDGMMPVKRHQQIYALLADELSGPVHALALHLYSPKEWQATGQRAPELPQLPWRRPVTPEVVRRHYLDAMGITAWACRYQLPNARPTEACEWEETPTKKPPRERLHALLDDAPAPRPRSQPAAAEQGNTSPVASPSAVKALLGHSPAAAPTPEASPVPEPRVPPAQPAKPLSFSLSCA